MMYWIDGSYAQLSTGEVPSSKMLRESRGSLGISSS